MCLRFLPFLALCAASLLLACSPAPDDGSGGSGTGANAPSTSGSGGEAGHGIGGNGGMQSQTCTPDETMDCYTGADGTLDVGLCVGGTKTCLPSGAAFGPCAGEVTPAEEDCSSAEDEDCNGYGCLQGEWGRLIGAGASDKVSHVSITPGGDYAITGNFSGQLKLADDHVLDAQGGTDIFVALIDKTGKVTWSKRLGTGGNDTAGGAVVDKDGAVYVGGAFPVGGQLDSTPIGAGPFLTKLDAMGDVVWASRLSTGTLGLVNRVVLSPSNTVVVCGQANLNLIGSQFGYAGQIDAFVLQVNPSTGTALSRLLFGNSLDDVAHDCAADKNGAIFVTGRFVGGLNLVAEGIKAYGGEDIFTLKYDTLNNLIEWVKTAGSAEQQQARALTLDPASGDVLVTGYAAGTVNFGGNDLIANPTKGNMFVVRYSSGGSHLASATFGTAASVQSAYGIDVLEGGDVLVAGGTASPTNLGGDVIGINGGQDAVLLRLDSDLVHVASRAYGSLTNDVLIDVGVDDDGRALVVGRAGDGIDCGSGALSGTASIDGLIARIVP